MAASRSASLALRLLVIAVAVSGVAACARSGSYVAKVQDPPPVASRGIMEAPVPAAFHRGDTDPHPGVDRARRMPIHGLDVARYQGRIDFDKVRQQGVHFVFIKGTEGKDYVDPMFKANWHGAKQAGLAYGAYHFMTWCSLASQQAKWFKKMVPADAAAMPPVLDLEWNNHSSCKNKHSKADILEKVRVMLQAMEEHTGKLPIIYTDIHFYHDILAGEHFPNAFWLRSTAAEPHERYADAEGWTFWQWTQTGSVGGVPTAVDRNVFYGGEKEWTLFLMTGCDPRAINALSPTGRCRVRN